MSISWAIITSLGGELRLRESLDKKSKESEVNYILKYLPQHERHCANTYKDFTYNDFTYNTNKWNIAYMLIIYSYK
jgi:hypothetical protein